MFTDEEVRLAIEAEEQHNRVASCIHLENGRTMVTQEFESVLYLDQLMKTAKRVGYSTEPVSRLVKTRVGRTEVRLTLAGKRLQVACKLYKGACYMGWGGMN